MMAGKRIVLRHLPVRWAEAGQWRLAGEKFIPVARQVGGMLTGDHSLLQDDPSVKILKQGRNRLCFRLTTGLSNPPTVVVKSFPLKGWKNSLYRHRHYALTEAANMLSARTCDIGVPELYAYGKFSRRLLVHCCAVIMEDLVQWVTLADLLRTSRTRREKRDHLQKTNQILRKLYQAGCYYFDMSPEHVMILPQSPGAVCRLIDLHYVRWLRRPSGPAWAAVAGMLAYHCKSYMDWDQLEGWFGQALEAMDFPEKVGLWRWFTRAAQRPYGREERRKMRFDSLEG